MDNNTHKSIFIVGSSRSGTTMLSRMLGSHSQIHAFEELHFFNLLNTKDQSAKSLIKVLNRLFEVERNGSFFDNSDGFQYEAESLDMVNNLLHKKSVRNLFEEFVFYEAGKNGKITPCEQTPMNLFYIEDIRDSFTNSAFINIVRDPRAVLASQKNRWKVGELGNRHISKHVINRLRYTYSPILHSILWKRSVRRSMRYSPDKDFYNVKFESVLKKSENTLKDIFAFLKIDYQSGVSKTVKKGSSHFKEGDNNKSIENNLEIWRDVLTNSEVYICEMICKSEMLAMGYEFKGARANFFIVAVYVLMAPFKGFAALFLNIKNHSSVLSAVYRRIKK